MKKNKLYVIEFDNMHWCGGTLYCVAWGTDEDDAADNASQHMEEAQRELFDDHYNDRDVDSDEAGEYDNEQAFYVVSVTLLEESDHAEHYRDATQRNNFYPCVNADKADCDSEWFQYM